MGCSFLYSCEGGITLKLAYGAVKDGDLDFAELSKDLVTVFEEAAAGHLVDAFPIRTVHFSHAIDLTLIRRILQSEAFASMDAWSRI